MWLRHIKCVFFNVKTWVYCRIDYHLATPAVAALARTEHIYKEQRFSDHAPMTVDYELRKLCITPKIVCQQ